MDFIKNDGIFTELNVTDQKFQMNKWVQRYETLAVTCDDDSWLIVKYKSLEEAEAIVRVTTKLKACKQQEALLSKKVKEE